MGKRYVRNYYFNPNLPTGVAGKVQNKPNGERKGGWRKKSCAACVAGPGLEPGIYHVLGDSPQLHATEVV